MSVQAGSVLSTVPGPSEHYVAGASIRFELALAQARKFRMSTLGEGLQHLTLPVYRKLAGMVVGDGSHEVLACDRVATRQYKAVLTPRDGTAAVEIYFGQ